MRGFTWVRARPSSLRSCGRMTVPGWLILLSRPAARGHQPAVRERAEPYGDGQHHGAQDAADAEALHAFERPRSGRKAGLARRGVSVVFKKCFAASEKCLTARCWFAYTCRAVAEICYLVAMEA